MTPLSITSSLGHTAPREDFDCLTEIEISPKLIIKPQEIVYLQADVNYTRIFLQDARCVIVTRTLGDFTDMLRGHSFFRIHRSYIVNLLYVGEYRQENQTLQLLNDKTVGISRRNQEAFRRALGELRSVE